MKICQWKDYDLLIKKVLRGIQDNKPVINSFPLLALTDDLEYQRKAARIWVQHNCITLTLNSSTSSNLSLDSSIHLSNRFVLLNVYISKKEEFVFISTLFKLII
jgi:hypothetical protein